MSWFILALIAMLCWSGSDLFSKMGSKPDDKLSHWKMVMAVGLVMGIHAGITMLGGVRVTVSDMITYLPASFLYILAMVLGYVGLRYIELSISSPICNTSGAAAALFCLIFLGEKLPELPVTLFGREMTLSLGLIAVILMAVGVLMLGIVETNEDEEIKRERRKAENMQYARSILALLLPILYCLIDAAGTVADSIILETLDETVANTAYELTFLVLGILAAIYVLVVKREKLEVPRETPKLLAAVCETAGQLAYIYAINTTVAAAPIISCYCLVSVLWSRIFLKEKLSWKHYLAIGIAAVGIVVMGVLDEM